MRMVGVPALKQSFNQIHAVKPQPGDVFFRIDIADLVISNASGYDHIVVIQLIQDLRRTEPVHHIDADLIIFPFRSLLLDQASAYLVMVLRTTYDPPLLSGQGPTYPITLSKVILHYT